MTARAPRVLPYSSSSRTVQEEMPRLLPYSASSRTMQEEEKIRDSVRDTRSPSTSTISSASRSWQDPQDNPFSRQIAESRDHPLWRQEVRQLSLSKQPSLPIPCSPADSGPLPSLSGRTRIPKAQVFLSRPTTPRPSTPLNSRNSGRRPPRPDARPDPRYELSPEPIRAMPRCVSDYVFITSVDDDEKSHKPLQRSSSARACTPAPDFWKKTAQMSYEMLHDVELQPDQHHHISKLRPESPVEIPGRGYDSDFDESELSMHSEPPSKSDVAAVFGDDDRRNGILNSLRNLNFRRNKPAHDPWNVPDVRAPTPRIIDIFTGGGDPYKPPQERQRGIGPRVFSFDPYRGASPAPFRRNNRRNLFTSASENRAPVHRTGGEEISRREDGLMRVSMRCDEYVGFMGVVPSRRDLVKVKSRKWWGRLVGRRGTDKTFN